jgi:ABC-type branched-subunit amino acid transport system substrate-binding protein
VHAKAFASALTDRGITAVDQQPLTIDALDATVGALIAGAPPAVFVACSGAEAALACSVLRRRGVKSALLAAGPPDVRSLPEGERAALDGVLAASTFDPGAAAGPAAELAALHRARHAEPPDERAFLGWLAGRRAIAALERAREYWPADVRAALSATDGPPLPFVVVRVEQGTLRRASGPKD